VADDAKFFEISHNLKGFISYSYIMILSQILAMRHDHTLSFLDIISRSTSLLAYERVNVFLFMAIMFSLIKLN